MNPAIITLLKSHLAARLRRVGKSFSSRRRILLSMLTVVLTAVWLGQTIFSVLLREPYDPAAFRNWVSFGLMAYFAWHIVRVAWKRPDEAIEWSPEERALVVDGPFRRTEILTYRVFVIFTSTLPKALLTWFVLWPDLQWASPFGILLALVILEFIRMVMDLGSHCLTNRGYREYRSIIAFAIISTAAITWSQFTSADGPSFAAGFTAGLESLRSTWMMQVSEPPFSIAADVICGNGPTGVLLAKLTGMAAVTGLMACLVVGLDTVYRRQLIQREKEQPTRIRPTVTQESSGTTTLPGIPMGGLVGPLAWRQGKRARRYAGSLVISMGIPAVLSMMPLYSVPNPTIAFVAVVCGVLFYTFVLLPEAIKFDFRLDSDHLAQLKMLPMTSTRIVLGQLFIPVALACGFQVAVILFAATVRSVDPVLVIGSLGLVIPLTILFVALDNLIFLLYPHRPTQEGFEAFLRTILKFTGKSLLLVAAGGGLVLWAPIAAWMAGTIDRVISPPAIFLTGVCLGITVMAYIAMHFVVTAYDRFDVSLDSVG
jgi:hypothetical protein